MKSKHGHTPVSEEVFGANLLEWKEDMTTENKNNKNTKLFKYVFLAAGFLTIEQVLVGLQDGIEVQYRIDMIDKLGEEGLNEEIKMVI
jgi:hypothetical protein